MCVRIISNNIGEGQTSNICITTVFQEIGMRLPNSKLYGILWGFTCFITFCTRKFNRASEVLTGNV